MAEQLWYDGQPVPFEPGQTVAAALWNAGIRSWHARGGSGRSHGLVCGIGSCFRCLAVIDGEADQRACLAPARSGMVVNGAVHDATSASGGIPAPRRTRAAATGRYDVAVVGGGPAGLAAAATASLAGARVVLVDAAPRPGGQFWRHRAGEDGRHGYRNWPIFAGMLSIVEERVDHIGDATVWLAEPGFLLHTTAGRLAAERLVLATGAYDRTVPFPGWELPGVVTPGAAQALLKGSGVRIGAEVVVAGAGPFLLPVAVALAEAGARVVGVYEAGDPRPYLRRPGTMAGVPGRLGEAAGYAAVLARHRVRYRTRHAVVAAVGTEATGVSAVDVAPLDGQGRVSGATERVSCDAIAVGYGFTANLDLALALGCATRLGVDGGLAVLVGEAGQTSVPAVYAAGEITGVGGAELAVVEGELAGSAAAVAAGLAAPLSSREITALRRRRDRLRRFADVMHAAHRVPASWPEWLADDTVVCRCEEVPYGRVERAVTELHASDARSVKLLARPGMGWCQGRMCGYPTAHLAARACGRPVTEEDLIALAQRPFAAPVRLGELAGGDVARSGDLARSGEGVTSTLDKEAVD